MLPESEEALGGYAGALPDCNDPDVSEQLRPFHIKVSWRSISEKKIHSERYLLDVSAYDGLPGLIEKPPLVKIADELESIKSNLGKLAANGNATLQFLDTTKLEHATRCVRPVSSPDIEKGPN